MWVEVAEGVCERGVILKGVCVCGIIIQGVCEGGVVMEGVGVWGAADESRLPPPDVERPRLMCLSQSCVYVQNLICICIHIYSHLTHCHVGRPCVLLCAVPPPTLYICTYTYMHMHTYLPAPDAQSGEAPLFDVPLPILHICIYLYMHMHAYLHASVALRFGALLFDVAVPFLCIYIHVYVYAYTQVYTRLSRNDFGRPYLMCLS